MSLTGRCACGAVTFEAAGEGDASFCHCEDCRRVSGAPMALFVGFAPSAVTISGALTDRWNGTVLRQHCSACGASMTYTDVTIPDRLVWLSGGTFDEPARLKPNRHAFWDERLPWLAITDDLPKFARFTVRREGEAEGPSPEKETPPTA